MARLRILLPVIWSKWVPLLALNSAADGLAKAKISVQFRQFDVFVAETVAFDCEWFPDGLLF
jgi:hypothetical protein